MLRTGRTEEELMQLVAKIDELTDIDSTISVGHKIVIRAEMCGVEEADEEGNIIYDEDGKPTINCHIQNWEFEMNPSRIPPREYVEAPLPMHHRGRKKKRIDLSKSEMNSMDALMATLDSIRQTEAPLNEEIVVLCLASTKEYRQFNGKIITNWIVINPTIPFEMVNNSPEFPTLELEMTDGEYKLALESRLALYNEFTHIIYPIREVAFSSIGKLLDSAASFKNMATIPLGSALLLADRLAEPQKELKFIYRNAKGNVKPLIGIAGSRFAEDSQYGFFRDGLDYIGETFGIYTMKSWEITDDLSTVNVYLNQYERDDARVYLRLQTSDIPGTSASVTAFLEISDKQAMPLKPSAIIQKNSAYHWDSFKDKGGVKGLFVHYDKNDKKRKNPIFIKDEIEHFMEMYDAVCGANVLYDGEDIAMKEDEIVKLIGKKRAKDLESKVVRGNVYNGGELYHTLVKKTFDTLPVKQANELTKLYADLLIAIRDLGHNGTQQAV